ncbi:branched-chain amino acid ABC transporter permease [Celeribacter sp.]|uniref:branched-chain amino acid ABC transporter permease n=1 Tax=Celeribacter sp. TaxID=1890673 RepID=UPI003A8CAC63
MIDILLQGVLLGGYYALLAVGLAFLYSIMGIINLAHGSFAVLAAYLVLAMTDSLGINVWLAVLAVLPIMAVIGALVDRLIFEPVQKGGQLLSVLATFGLSVVIDNLIFQIWGANTRTLANALGDLAWASWEIGGLWVGKVSVYILLAAVGLLTGLTLLIARTPLGRAIRATATDPDTAGLVGVDARRARTIASALAFVAIGVAGAALGMRTTFTPYAGVTQLLFAFQAAVIGGSTSVRGTLFGGITLGLAQTLGATIHTQGFLIGGHLVFFAALFLRLQFGTLRLPKLRRASA